MKSWKVVLLIPPLSLALVLVTVAIVIACKPSAVPTPCPQTTFVAVYAPRPVVTPPEGGTASIGVLPFLRWANTTPGCAQPTGASVTFSLECTPAGGGAPFTLGPQGFEVAAPTEPGQQPVPGGVLDFPIPAGTPASVCTATGTYEVTFAGGLGEGSLSVTSEAPVCLVEPSPWDPSLPRVDLEVLTPPGASGVLTLHQGDQDVIFVRMANNDLANAATFNLKTEGKQVAGLPDGFLSDEAAYNAGLFRISNPDGDVFPAQLVRDAAPLDRIPGDPESADPGRLEDQITLGPGEVGLFGIAINSYGACGDGSCNQRFVCADVTLTRDGAPPEVTNVCTGFVYLVDNTQQPGWPGLTIADEIKVAPDKIVDWSTVTFRNSRGKVIDETHATNLLPGAGITGDVFIRTTGTNVALPPGESRFSDKWADRITLDVDPMESTVEALWFDARHDPTQSKEVILSGLDPLLGECVVPDITFLNPTNPQNPRFRVVVDASDGCGENMEVRLFEFLNGEYQQVQQGPLTYSPH